MSRLSNAVVGCLVIAVCSAAFSGEYTGPVEEVRTCHSIADIKSEIQLKEQKAVAHKQEHRFCVAALEGFLTRQEKSLGDDYFLFNEKLDGEQSRQTLVRLGYSTLSSFPSNLSDKDKVIIQGTVEPSSDYMQLMEAGGDEGSMYSEVWKVNKLTVHSSGFYIWVHKLALHEESAGKKDAASDPLQSHTTGSVEQQPVFDDKPMEPVVKDDL